jgi:hypothetical protein
MGGGYRDVGVVGFEQPRQSGDGPSVSAETHTADGADQVKPFQGSQGGTQSVIDRRVGIGFQRIPGHVRHLAVVEHPHQGFDRGARRVA